MTRILFVPNDKSMIMLVSSLPAEKLAADVNTGTWEPPPPYGYLASQPGKGNNPSTMRNNRLLYALQLNHTVIITPISRRILSRNRSTWEEGWKALNKRYSSLYPDNASVEDEALAPSPRQMQVLRGLAVGLNIKQVALSLGITERTVRSYIKELKVSFRANTHAELVGRAVALGLLDEDHF